MVDLQSQYHKIKGEVDVAMQNVIDQANFINGPEVGYFKIDLEKYLGVDHVIPCANGTDALQIAMMALHLEQGDEVIVPAFTYAATAEVIALLGLTPVMVDVNPENFNIDINQINDKITEKTKAIVPVHLFGQCSAMEAIMKIANDHNIFVIEDNAQAIGADYIDMHGAVQKAGTIGHIGCTSFFPSKNLGCFGDGGAMMTNDAELAQKMKAIANHGQTVKYYHDTIGCNSRLDTLQASVLMIKLRYLDQYIAARQKAADYYDAMLSNVEGIKIPTRVRMSSHVFHQYTLIVSDGKREKLQAYLKERNVPTMVYYPVPLYKQKAFAKYVDASFSLPVTEELCKSVLSLPMHTELTEEIQDVIINAIKTFFK